MGNFLGKRDEHYCLEQGFGFDNWDVVHVDNRFYQQKCQVCYVMSKNASFASSKVSQIL